MLFMDCQWEKTWVCPHIVPDHTGHLLLCQEKNTHSTIISQRQESPAAFFGRLLVQTPEGIIRKVVLAPVEMWAFAQSRSIKRLISYLPQLNPQTFLLYLRTKVDYNVNFKEKIRSAQNDSPVSKSPSLV